MDFLSAITPQIAVLGLGVLVLAVVTFVLVSLTLHHANGFPVVGVHLAATFWRLP